MGGKQSAEFDQASSLFLDAFLEVHPRATWPSWFRKCTICDGQKEDVKRWRFSFTALPSSMLQPGELWERTERGGYVLARIDPNTGEKRYVISNSRSGILTIFEAVIDLDSDRVSVTYDRDLAAIAEDELLPLQD